MKSYWSLLILCLLATSTFGQLREASDLESVPRDGIYNKSTVASKQMLTYDHLTIY